MFPAPKAEPAWPFWAAFSLLIIGWIPCDTFFTTVGALQLHFHFFDLATVIARPARLATGVNRGDAWTIPFGILCLAAIAATVAPRYSSRRAAQWGPCAPLALMLICGALFYRVATADTFVVTSDASAVGAALARLGNALAGRASAVVARHISVGLGLLLSFPAAAYLAYGSLRVVREPQSGMLPGSSL